jgi:hypothetical protein
MRRLAFMACACASLALASCGGLGGGVASGGSAAPVVQTVTIEGTRALIIAELSYNTAASAALAAVRTGLLKGEAAERVQAYNRTAFTALSTAKATQSAIVQAGAVSDALNAIAQLSAMTPKIGSN